MCWTTSKPSSPSTTSSSSTATRSSAIAGRCWTSIRPSENGCCREFLPSPLDGGGSEWGWSPLAPSGLRPPSPTKGEGRQDRGRNDQGPTIKATSPLSRGPGDARPPVDLARLGTGQGPGRSQGPLPESHRPIGPGCGHGRPRLGRRGPYRHDPALGEREPPTRGGTDAFRAHHHHLAGHGGRPDFPARHLFGPAADGSRDQAGDVLGRIRRTLLGGSPAVLESVGHDPYLQQWTRRDVESDAPGPRARSCCCRPPTRPHRRAPTIPWPVRSPAC